MWASSMRARLDDGGSVSSLSSSGSSPAPAQQPPPGVVRSYRSRSSFIAEESTQHRPSFIDGDAAAGAAAATSSSAAAAASHRRPSLVDISPPSDGNAGPPTMPALFRLVSNPDVPPPSVDWDAVLARSKSHPHESCCFDGTTGQAYVLHRILRRRRDRAPPAVIEGVMAACPRAVTRKQAVRHAAGGDNDGNNEEGGGGGGGDASYEYPLSIGCETHQDREVIRLLASWVWRAKPAYRSEVFRSLDYEQLGNSIVRILLEEYPAGVLERGTASEENEGDDDDCPLEKVLFWWDDPDMTGLEDDIDAYPRCDRREELEENWEKLRMMLVAATQGTMAGYDELKGGFQMLHHILKIVSEGGVGGVHFPNDFSHAAFMLLRFIARTNPRQFMERDDSDGRLPLHIVVSGGLLRPHEEVDGNAEGAAVQLNPQGDENIAEVNAEGDAQQLAQDNAGGAVDGELQLPDAEQEEDNPNLEGEGAEGAGDDNNDGNVPVNNNDEPAVVVQDQQGGEEGNGEDASEGGSDDEENDDSDQSVEAQNENEGGEDGAPPSSAMEILKLLLERHPDSVYMRDLQRGSLPLHLTIRHNPQCSAVIMMLLELHPESVRIPDGEGRVPIHLALQHRCPIWEVILDLAPEALETRDVTTRFYPFQTAAAAAKPSQHGDGEDSVSSNLASLNIIFRLLRMSPVLASGLGVVKHSQLRQSIMSKYKPRVVLLEEENRELKRLVEDLRRQVAVLEMRAQQKTSATDHLESVGGAAKSSTKKRKLSRDRPS